MLDTTRLCTTLLPGRHEAVAPAVARIGRTMSSHSAQVDLVPVLGSVVLARHLTVNVLRSWGSPHDLDDVALVVSELVANVVDHATTEPVLTLELALAGDWLRIGVVDGSALRPVLRALSQERPRGRGLQLVAAIADRWGVEEHHGGKRVWLELTRPAA